MRKPSSIALVIMTLTLLGASCSADTVDGDASNIVVEPVDAKATSVPDEAAPTHTPAQEPTTREVAVDTSQPDCSPRVTEEDSAVFGSNVRFDANGDGSDDVLSLARRSSGGAEVWVETADGLSNPSAIRWSDPTLPPKVFGATDMDGDDRDEVLIYGGGNTTELAHIYSLEGCTFAPLVDDAGIEVSITVDGWGNSCVPLGCWLATRCDEAGSIEHIEISPNGEGSVDRFETVYELVEARITETTELVGTFADAIDAGAMGVSGQVFNCVTS